MESISNENKLFCGDNLKILQSLKTESVDLCYIDPPFFTQKDWGEFNDKFESINTYIEFMKKRIIEIHQILKTTGSFYLHCDYHAESYLRVMCDKIFGYNRFMSEIVWKRHNTHNDSKSFGNITDTILYYSKSNKRIWNPQYIKSAKNPKRYSKKDENGFYTTGNLGAKGLSGGGYEYEWNGIKTIWRLPKSSMEEWDKQGRIHYSKTGRAYKKRYLSNYKGNSISNLWDDINPVSNSKESLGYPTQKPEALLERIIKTS